MYPSLRDCNNVTAVEQESEKTTDKAQTGFGNDGEYALQDTSKESLGLTFDFLSFWSIIKGVEPWRLDYDIGLIEASN
jgi:hypothetical protein